MNADEKCVSSDEQIYEEEDEQHSMEATLIVVHLWLLSKDGQGSAGVSISKSNTNVY